MTSSTKIFRTTILTLSAAILVVPQVAFAGGGSFGGGKTGPSSGNGSFGMGKGPGSHVVRQPVSSLISGASTTINSTSSKVIAPTVHNNAGNSVSSSGDKTTKIVASASNLNGSGGFLGTQSTPHSQQIRDSVLGEINGVATALTGGPFNDIEPASPDGTHTSTDDAQGGSTNHLTNGADSGYGDGGTLPPPKQSSGNGQVQMTVTPIFPSTPNGVPYSAGKGTQGKQLVVNDKASGPQAQTLSNVGNSDNAKNVNGINPFGTVKNASGKDNASTISAAYKAPATNSNDGPPIPLPPNSKPYPMPFPFPSGSVYGGSNVDDSSATVNSDSVPPTMAPVAATGVDLVLEDVRLASPETVVAGPAYTIVIRNQGTQASGKFVVGVFATLDEKLSMQSPHATVELPVMTGGQVRSVTLRLPQAALKLTDKDGKPTEFTKLIVIVDLNNSLLETDKSNNSAAVDRAAVKRVILPAK